MDSKSNGKEHLGTGADNNTEDKTKHCRECWLRFNNSDFRRVEDECGHVKCLRCFKKSDICIMCLRNKKASSEKAKPSWTSCSTASASATAGPTIAPPSVSFQNDEIFTSEMIETALEISNMDNTRATLINAMNVLKETDLYLIRWDLVRVPKNMLGIYQFEDENDMDFTEENDQITMQSDSSLLSNYVSEFFNPHGDRDDSMDLAFGTNFEEEGMDEEDQ